MTQKRKQQDNPRSTAHQWKRKEKNINNSKLRDR